MQLPSTAFAFAFSTGGTVDPTIGWNDKTTGSSCPNVSQRRMELFVCALVPQAGILEAQEKKAALETLLTCGTASALECL